MLKRNSRGADEAPFSHATSLVGGGVVGRLVGAGVLAALLWVAAAWAMGWLS